MKINFVKTKRIVFTEHYLLISRFVIISAVKPTILYYSVS
jgi:hypothetical protein